MSVTGRCDGCGGSPSHFYDVGGSSLCLPCATMRNEADITASEAVLACVEGVARAALNGEAHPDDVLERVGEVIAGTGPHLSDRRADMHVVQRRLYEARAAAREASS